MVEMIQRLSMISGLVPVVWGAIWLVLLIWCWRKRQYWKIFEREGLTRRFWLSTFAFFNLGMLFLFFVFGLLRSPKKPANRAMRWSLRTAVVLLVILGFWVRVPVFTHGWMEFFRGPELCGANGFYMNAATIVSKQSSSSESSTSRINDSQISCRSLWLVPGDDDVLTLMVCDQLEKALGKSRQIETIAYWRNRVVGPERHNSDIIMQVKAVRYDTHTMPLKYDLNATVKAIAFNGPWGCRSYYVNSQSVPETSFNWNCTIDHVSTTTGYESYKFTLAARKIAQELTELLDKFIEGDKKKHGLAADFPDYFYPEFDAVDLPKGLMRAQAQPLYTCLRVMVPNETLFRIPLFESKQDTLEALCGTFEEDGWRTDSKTITEKQFNNLRFSKGNQIVQVYDISDELAEWPLGPLLDRPRAEEDVKTYLYGYYRTMIDDTARQEILIRYLDETESIDQLMQLDNMYRGKLLRSRWKERLAAADLTSVRALVRLGEFYRTDHEREKAMTQLKKALVLSFIGPGGKDYSSQIKSLAKHLDAEAMVDGEIDVQMLKNMGAIDEEEIADELDMNLPLERPLILYAENSNAELLTYLMQLKEADGRAEGYSMVFAEGRKAGKSWGTRSCNYSPDNGYVVNGDFQIDDEARVLIQLSYRQEDGQVRYHLKRYNLPRTKNSRLETGE